MKRIEDMDYSDLCDLADKLEDVIYGLEMAEKLDIETTDEAERILEEVDNRISELDDEKLKELNREYMKEAFV